MYAQPYTICDDNADTLSLCDTKGNKVVFKQYTRFENFNGNWVYAYNAQNNMGLLDLESGQEIFPCQYQAIHPCSHTYEVFFLKKQGKAFFYNSTTGKPLFPPFNDIMPNGQSYIPIDGNVAYVEPDQPFLCRVQDKCGAMDVNGKIMIPFEYDDLQTYYYVPDDFMIARRKGEYLVLTREGKPLNEKRYSGMTGYWDENHIMAWRGNTPVFIDRGGNEMPWFETAQRTAAFRKDGKFAFFNIRGRQLTPYAYEGMYAQGDYAYVDNNGKRGVVDTNGREIIPLKYEGVEMHASSQGALFQLQDKGKYGMADSKGNIIAPLVYDYIIFHEPYSIITKGDREGYLKHDGTELLPCKYDDVYFFGEGNMAGASLDGKWGFINEKGEAVIPFKYDKVDYFREGKAQMQLNGRGGYLDLTGKETWY